MKWKTFAGVQTLNHLDKLVSKLVEKNKFQQPNFNFILIPTTFHVRFIYFFIIIKPMIMNYWFLNK
ncbi:hypothetical protein RhiirA1_92900 [Rhizophagus irregularis]|uniref:Uncharacterized protein n=1 Tax=Rhizophagus irregularis TaxID=588596 RepID=A0A2N0R0B9_9GLOM|nr:hypothetical protein RhiirA1_92900 [Rhizophagus irregularis]